MENQGQTQDLSDGWVVECNDAPEGETAKWVTVWETWWIEDDREADRIEKEHAKSGRKFLMKPRTAVDCIERLKALRPNRAEWTDYRLRHAETGELILAWVLK